MTRVVGIDPGLTGALALVADGGLVDVVDMPVVGGAVDPYALAEVLATWGQVDRVAVERAQAYPGMGVSSAFNYGAGWGAVLGVLAVLERPVVHIAASKWTRALGVVGKDKDSHRRRATELFPSFSTAFSRRKDDGRADAALIAHWLMSTLRVVA